MRAVPVVRSAGVEVRLATLAAPLAVRISTMASRPTKVVITRVGGRGER